MKIFSANFRSLRNKLQLFKCKLIELNIDIFCGCETWLSDDIPNNFIAKNYTIYRRDRVTNTRGGGVIVGIKSSIKSIERKFIIDSNIEVIFVEVIIKNVKILISSAYRPPNLDFPSFFNSLNQILIQIERNNYFELIIITGDYNVDFSSNNKLNNNFIIFNDVMIDHGFEQIVDKFTYPNSSDSKAIYDLFFTNNSSYVKNIEVIENICVSCDHKALLCSLNILKKKKNNKKIKLLNINNDIIMKLNDKLNEVDWNEVMNSDDINEIYTNIISKYENISENFLCYKECRIGNNSFRIDADIRRLLVRKREAYKKLCENRNFKNFCKYYDLYNSVSKKLDENYNRSLNHIIENSLNLKCLYKFIKDINQEKISNCFETDGSLITVG